MSRETVDCDVLVIGSGPGGATTAALLAEAGRDVVMIEEGPDLGVDSAPNYTIAEMNQKYRNGGLTATLGKTSVTYIEGRCVGGGSEVNAALYHRPLAETLRTWQLQYQIDDFDPDALWPFFEAVERDTTVSRFPNGVGPASDRIKLGADRLGWKSSEIARFWKYTKGPDGNLQGRRQSMTETFVPRARKAGCRLLADTRVTRLKIEGDRAVSAEAVKGAERKKITIRFKDVFVCCGAIQSPMLLRRSGLTQNIGDTLRLHPMIRVAARFDEPVNDPSWGVPVQQIEEFKPLLTLGCSHSSLPHIMMWLGGTPEQKKAAMATWQNVAVFYVAAVGSGIGTIREVPVFGEPMVRFNVLDSDLALVGEGLYRLGQALFAAGAREIYSPVAGGPTIRGLGDLVGYRTGLPHGKMAVSTIHLFSSAPMGEDRRSCAVDSYGRVHGLQNVRVNDASILPRSPAVNPQGTVLAIARRNALQFLATR